MISNNKSFLSNNSREQKLSVFKCPVILNRYEGSNILLFTLFYWWTAKLKILHYTASQCKDCFERFSMPGQKFFLNRY